jgi:undecaprenyl pyrophosphate synthase
MDKIVGLKRIEMSLNVSQVLNTLIKISSGMQDRESLLAIISRLSMRELEAFKTKAELRVRIMDIVTRFYEQRIQEYRETLKKALFLSCFRRLTVERRAMELATKDAQTFVEILSGKEELELLHGGKQALMQAVQELLRMLKANPCSLDFNQLAGKLKYAVE